MTHVLIVDDEPLVRIAVRSLENWEREGITIVGEACHGEEALAFLSLHPEVDIVLIDVDMPVLNGLEFAEKAVERNLPQKIIFLSAFDSFEFARRAFKAGAFDYILKTELDKGKLLSLFKQVQLERGLQIQEGFIPLTEKKNTEICSVLAGTIESPRLPYAITFPMTLLLFRPSDENLINKRYGDNPESIIRLTTDLLRQCIVTFQSGEVFSLSLCRYVVLMDSLANEKAVINEFIRTAKAYLDLSFESSNFSDISGWSGLRNAYVQAEKLFSPTSRMVMMAKKYIQQNYTNQELDLATIAEYVQISKNHLSWEFSKETGETISIYLAKVRIEQAIKLLSGTNAMTYEISEAVGFKNVETFARVFKKITGKTPRGF
jgi:two-component system response regulator YesN